MQPARKPELAERYASFTDEEILALALDRDSLTEPARLALADEMRKRKLTDESVREFAATDAGSEQQELPPEVEYASAANVPLSDADALIYREPLIAAASLRSEAWLLMKICAGGMCLLGIIDKGCGTRGIMTLIGAAITLFVQFRYWNRLRDIRCPRCEARVPFKGKYIRCASCQLLIYPVE